MNELITQSLLKMFAIIASIKNEQVQKLAENYVELYFSSFFSSRTAKLKKEDFRNYILQIKQHPNVGNIEHICSNLNKELSKGQRVILLINLLEFISFTEKIVLKFPNQEDPLRIFIQTVARELRISDKTLNNCKDFVSEQYYDIQDQELLIIAKDKDPGFKRSKYIQIQEVKGHFVFFYIEEIGQFIFTYHGSDPIELNGKHIFPRLIFVFGSGSLISTYHKPILLFSQLISLVKITEYKDFVNLTLTNVSYTHFRSTFGVRKLNLSCNSGDLVGIIGGSGSGKTTLLNIINGSLTPDEGDILLNGLSYSTDLQQIQAVIGYIPQDDALLGELTVFENLYYTTRLSNGLLSREDATALVESKLNEFSLYQIRNNKVGLTIKRIISGGQRKRLNIVTETIREPLVLLVDEPTSGLSSLDSIKIITLLKEQASSGKLVIVNIHQPSSEIFKLFDKILVLDQGGFMAFFGNPLEAIKYFREKSNKIDYAKIECESCHNIKPDEIFEIIEDKVVDDFGNFTEIRKVEPQTWCDEFIKSKINITRVDPPTSIPVAKSKRPSLTKQFELFSSRYFKRKFRDFEFFIFSLLIPSFLSVVLSIYSKYFVNENNTLNYIFYENDNLPIFFLMSIVASLFTGMIISADCIIKDASLRNREKFLFLSSFSYLNSRVFFFFLLSIMQSLIFTIIAIAILEIPNFFIQFWLILFLSGLIGTLIGLIVSSVLKSTAAAFIIIPFLVIPQIIFSGIAIPFEKLNPKLSISNQVPLIGNLSISRWGIEALIVEQYVKNDYEKLFYDIDQKESKFRIKAYFLVPEAYQVINDIKAKKSNNTNNDYKLLNEAISRIGYLKPPGGNQLNKKELEILEFDISELKNQLAKQHSTLLKTRDSATSALAKKLGSFDALNTLKNNNVNKGIEKLVLNREARSVYVVDNNKFYQQIDQVYLIPESGLFKAHFYAPIKIVFNSKLDTYTINSIILFIYALLLYLILLSDVLNIILKYLLTVFNGLVFFLKLHFYNYKQA